MSKIITIIKKIFAWLTPNRNLGKIYYNREINRLMQVRTINKLRTIVTLSNAEYYGDAKTTICEEPYSMKYLAKLIHVRKVDECDFLKFCGVGWRVIGE